MDSVVLLIAFAFLTLSLSMPFFSRLHIPLSFSPLFLGMLLGLFPFWQSVASSETFRWFANLGMLFMIYSVVFQWSRSSGIGKGFGKFLVESGLSVIILEIIIIFPIVYIFLEHRFLSSLLVSAIFTTVAEAMVIPFLEKFKIANTKLGTSIIGIGILDNVIEALIIVIAAFYSLNDFNLGMLILVFFVAFSFIIGISNLGRTSYMKHLISNASSSNLLLFSVAVMFLLTGALSLVGLEFLGAVLAALLFRNILNNHQTKYRELRGHIEVLSLGLFGPVFFLWVGITTNLSYIAQEPVLAVIFVMIGFLAKLIPVIMVTKKELGIHSSVILGIALKFGAGILFIKLLAEKGIINPRTYTLVIAAILFYRVINPLLLGTLITRWKKYIH